MPESSSLKPQRIQIGLLLSGCGHYDGTDAQEAVFCGLALDRAGSRVIGLAPRRPLFHTVDHTSGEEMASGPRDLVLEASRLLHEKVHPVPGYALDMLQGLVVPGGFGCAKNLMSGFARLGEKRSVYPEVLEVIQHFLAKGKPVGTVGLGEIPVRSILGLPLEDPEPQANPETIWIDSQRPLFSTPGYKAFTRSAEVAMGIEIMIAEMVKRIWEK